MATRTVATSALTLQWGNTSSWVEGFIPTAADDVVFTSGSGSLTLNIAGVCKSIDFTNYASGKTITFSNNITVSGNINLGSGLYTQAGANGLVINANSTLTSNGITWSRAFTTYPTAGTTITLTLVGNWTQAGTTIFNQFGNATTFTTINSNSFIFASGTFNVGITNLTTVNGTSTILFSSGTIALSSSTGIYQNNLTVATSGSVTFQGSFYYSTGTFTYTSGSVTSSAGAFQIGNNGVTTTINSGALVFLSFTLPNTYINTIILNSNLNANTITLGTGVLTVSGTGRLIPSTLLSLAGTQTYDTTIFQSIINVNNLTFGGGPSTVVFNSITVNVSTLLTLAAGTFSGSSIINMTGGTISGSTGTGILKLNLNIAGNVTITGILSYNTGTLTYVSGTVTTTSSTLSCILSTTLDTGNGSGGTHIAWNNVTLGAAAGITATLNSNLYWSGNMILQYVITFAGTGLLIPDNNTTTTLTFGTQNSNNNYSSAFASPLNIKNLTCNTTVNTYIITFNGITTNINGSFTLSTGSLIGTSNLNMVGTGNIQGGSGNTFYIQNNITINTSGIITFPVSTLFSYNTGTFTYTSGTVYCYGTLICYFTGSTTTFNTGSGTGISWNIFLLSNVTQTFIFNSTFTAQSMVFGQNGAFTFSGSAGFIIGTISCAYSSSFNMILKSGNYYRITNIFNFSASNNNSSASVLSTISGSPAYLTLDYGAVSNIAYMTFTDIDASGGRTINAWRSFGITRCVNIRSYTDLQNIRS